MFDEKPFVIYRNVTIRKTVSGTSYPSGDGLTHMPVFSGTFTIEFAAYDPYGYLAYKAYHDYDYDGARVYCGMIEENEMPAAPTTDSRSFLLYNCGTQACDTVLTIGGSAQGITIRNLTNGTKCVLNSLPANGYLEIDSAYGTIKHISGNTEA